MVLDGYLITTPDTQVNATTMTDTTPWEEYCEASLDLSNQDDVGDPQAPLDPELLMGAGCWRSTSSPRSGVIDGS